MGIRNKAHLDNIIADLLDQATAEQGLDTLNHKPRLTFCVEGNISAGKSSFLDYITNGSPTLQEALSVSTALAVLIHSCHAMLTSATGFLLCWHASATAPSLIAFALPLLVNARLAATKRLYSQVTLAHVQQCMVHIYTIIKTPAMLRVISLHDMIIAEMPHQVVPEPVDKWTKVQKNGGNTLNLLDEFYRDPKKYAYAFQNYVFLTRMHQVGWGMPAAARNIPASDSLCHVTY